jgi:hypothetical protein
VIGATESTTAQELASKSTPQKSPIGLFGAEMPVAGCLASAGLLQLLHFF